MESVPALQARTSGLQVRRILAGAAAWPLRPGASALGMAAYGRAGLLRDAATDAAADFIGADVWEGSAPVQHGRCGAVHWGDDGSWLYGTAVLDESAAGGLAALTHRAYADIFATLRERGCPHLVRVWNYMSAINVEVSGLERYRQFNQGRHDAFIEAGAAAFEGAPAACALGLHSPAPLSICFLGSRLPARPVENPRQVSAYRYPPAYGPRSPNFSRATLVQASPGEVALFVSGTASIVGHTTVHAGDLGRQLDETLVNLQVLLDAVHAQTSARFALPSLSMTGYVRHPADLPEVRTRLEEALGPQSPALAGLLLMEADICRADLLVEIEAHATAAGQL